MTKAKLIVVVLLGLAFGSTAFAVNRGVLEAPDSSSPLVWVALIVLAGLKLVSRRMH